jgi:SsrA-binding protein
MSAALPTPSTTPQFSAQLLMAGKKSKKKTSDRQKSAGKKSGPGIGQSKTIAENRKARHRFEILESIECGVVLIGPEVKSLREGKISLDEAYVRVIDGELWMVGADIAEYRQASFWNHQPRRHRKLLVHRRQLKKLSGRAFEKGLTLIPLKMYFTSRGIVKVIVGVGRGKKLHDKRQTLKNADAKRQISREMKQRQR